MSRRLILLLLAAAIVVGLDACSSSRTIPEAPASLPQTAQVREPDPPAQPVQHVASSAAAGKRAYSRPSEVEIQKRLTPLQHYVTQEEGTERPFDNEYWDNTQDGIYVDIVSGEPLFSSHDKYKSGTGWPSFTQPLVAANIIEKSDRTLFFPRIEIRSKHGDSHLGHVFDDGPDPTGLRYCMNSAAMRFVPAEKLEEEGYGEFSRLFDEGE